MTERDIDQIAWAITDLRQCLTALGVKGAAIHIQMPAATLSAIAGTGSKWIERRGRDVTIRLAEAVFSVGG